MKWSKTGKQGTVKGEKEVVKWRWTEYYEELTDVEKQEAIDTCMAMKCVKNVHE